MAHAELVIPPPSQGWTAEFIEDARGTHLVLHVDGVGSVKLAGSAMPEISQLRGLAADIRDNPDIFASVIEKGV